MKSEVLAYACQTVWGNLTEDFWQALKNEIPPEHYTWEKQSLHQKLFSTLQELRSQASFCADDRLGVILASTKGEIDDYIWDEKTYLAHAHEDGLTPLLHRFLKTAELKPKLSLCVSNACASSHSAIFLGQRWIEQKRVDQVLIIATDHIGEFIEKGFRSLNALTNSHPKPFAKERDGLALGSGAAMVLIAKTNPQSKLVLGSVAIDVEGYAVTRPAPSGKSLVRAHQMLGNIPKPDLIIAHGTATLINDSAEDQAFFNLYGSTVPVTGSKWAVGHTLGTSGLLDVIAACEVLRAQSSFSLGTTLSADPALQCHYLTRGREATHAFKNILVSSLGFGGVHALTTVTLENPMS
jgi:hypothetical protein